MEPALSSDDSCDSEMKHMNSELIGKIIIIFVLSVFITFVVVMLTFR